MRIDHLGNLGVYEKIMLAGIRKHKGEVWNWFMCLNCVSVTEFASLNRPSNGIKCRDNLYQARYCS